MAERIGIFGGSFDPVHHGHISVVESFLNSNLLHALWVMPAVQPPHKQDLKLTPFYHRKRMLEIAFEKFEDDVSISDLENRLPSPSYTVNTLSYLTKKNPDSFFFLCLGEDNLINFHSWYRYKKILGQTTLIVAERPGFHKSEISDFILEKSIFVEHRPVAISSTDVRELKDKNKEGSTFEKIPEKISRYIKKNRLYN